MHIWRVNTRNQTLEIEPVPKTWVHLGGRGLIPRILLDEIPETCDPLGKNNKLIFAPGLLVGHMLSSCDRISVGGKSPLTGGIKESNAGGRTGLHLARLGIKALILEDQPNVDRWNVLYLSKEGVCFDKGDHLHGLGVYETARILLDTYGKKVSISMIGTGGEMGFPSAGILNLDKDAVPSRINARGGLGALMGSKKIKAIVIDDSGGTKPPIAHIDRFRQTQKVFNDALMAHPQIKAYGEYGTAGMTRMSNGFGGLPTRNFSSGNFEGAEKISGEYMRQLLLSRAGECNTTHACMAGCTIQCSNIFGGEEGQSIVSPIEYETIGLLGANLGIDDLDVIARLNWETNDLGLDSIEIGAALGLACEAGLMEFGDGNRALELLNEIRIGSVLGRLLGQGAQITGKVLGLRRIPAVKGQALSAYDPRAIKGTGVTYATSPQGADHTCGLTIRAKVDHLDPSGQAQLSRKSQISNAGYDSLGACIFAGFGFGGKPETIPELLNARYDWQVGKDILESLGRECLTLEREFNQKAGFTSADDRLPEWMLTEQLQPHNAVFDVSNEELDGVFKW